MCRYCWKWKKKKDGIRRYLGFCRIIQYQRSCLVMGFYICKMESGDERKRRKKAIRHSADSPSIVHSSPDDDTEPQLGSISFGKLCSREPSIYLILKYSPEKPWKLAGIAPDIQNHTHKTGVTIFQSGKSSLAFILIILWDDCMQGLPPFLKCLSPAYLFWPWNNPSCSFLTIRHFSLCFSVWSNARLPCCQLSGILSANL